jgi:hypothetical protein
MLALCICTWYRWCLSVDVLLFCVLQFKAFLFFFLAGVSWFEGNAYTRLFRYVGVCEANYYDAGLVVQECSTC